MNRTSNQFFVSLGAGPNQTPLIEAARNEGYRVIGIDKNPSAEGFSHCDLQVHSSVHKHKTIRRTLQESLTEGDVVAIGSRSYGETTLSQAILADKTGLAGPGPDAVRYLQNKKRLKTLARRKNLPAPPLFPCNSDTEIERFLEATVPMILRPNKSHAKKSITVIGANEDRTPWLEQAKSDDYLVERYIEGTESILFGFVLNGKLYTIAITDKAITDDNRFLDQMHVFPSGQPQNVRIEMIETAEKLVELTGIKTGPFFAEFLIPSRSGFAGEALLIEAACEVGGEMIADFLIPEALGIDYFSLLVQLLAGDLYEEDLSAIAKQAAAPASKSAVVGYFPPVYGELVDIRYDAGMNQDPYVKGFRALRKKGEFIYHSEGNRARPAVITLSGSVEERSLLIEKASDWLQRVEVVLQERQTLQAVAS